MRRPLAQAVVVITGASSGIGHATALAFAKHGSSVVLIGRGASALDDVVREIEDNGGTALPVVADVSRSEDIEHAIAATIERFGAIDVWVNNAAVAEWSLVENTCGG